MAKHEIMSFSAADVLDKLRQTDRTPFIELLAGWLECAPSADAVKAFAERAPERYVTAIVQIARLSGYAEKHDHMHNHTVNVTNLSDSQLEDQLQEKLRTLGLPAVIDLTPTAGEAGALTNTFVAKPLDADWVEVEQKERELRKANVASANDSTTDNH